MAWLLSALLLSSASGALARHLGEIDGAATPGPPAPALLTLVGRFWPGAEGSEAVLPQARGLLST